MRREEEGCSKKEREDELEERNVEGVGEETLIKSFLLRMVLRSEEGCAKESEKRWKKKEG